jgi:triacylglycerol lipase
MLAPPSQGSEMVDEWGHTRLFQWVNGPAGLELGTDAEALPARLPPPAYPVGIIAGTRSLNPFYSHHIPGRDDGKVAIARARLPGMRDFIALPFSHTWIMCRAETHRQILAFLDRGAFDHPPARGGGA